MNDSYCHIIPLLDNEAVGMFCQDICTVGRCVHMKVYILTTHLNTYIFVLRYIVLREKPQYKNHLIAYRVLSVLILLYLINGSPLNYLFLS